MIFVGMDCVATAVADVVPDHHITALDFGYAKAGESQTQSFRLGNDTANTQSYAISVADPSLSILPTAMGNLAAGELSGTLSIRLDVSLDCQTELIETVVTVETDSGTDLLDVSFYTVGAFEEWQDGTRFERVGDATQTFSGVVESFAQPYDLVKFSPVPYYNEYLDEYSELGEVREGVRMPLKDASEQVYIYRLSPTDPDRGYVPSCTRIWASFQTESEDRTYAFSLENQTATYASRASIFVPAWTNLSRDWALYAYESTDGTTQAQYKRSVFLIRRADRVYSLENLRPVEFKQDLSYYEADLIEVHAPTAASALSDLHCWVEFSQLDSGVGGGESPVDARMPFIS